MSIIRIQFSIGCVSFRVPHDRRLVTVEYGSLRRFYIFTALHQQFPHLHVALEGLNALFGLFGLPIHH